MHVFIGIVVLFWFALYVLLPLCIMLCVGMAQACNGVMAMPGGKYIALVVVIAFIAMCV